MRALSSVRIEREASNLNVGGSNPSVPVGVTPMIGVLHTSAPPMVEGAIYGGLVVVAWLASFWLYHMWAMQEIKEEIKDGAESKVESHEVIHHDKNNRR